MQYKVKWSELTKEQKTRATENYQAIRETEEGKPCSLNRAKNNVPYCNEFWLETNDPDYLEVEI